jgi:hypothetical protein
VIGAATGSGSFVPRVPADPRLLQGAGAGRQKAPEERAATIRKELDEARRLGGRAGLALARTALAQADEGDHYVAFEKPIEVVSFLPWQGGDVVEIDIEDSQAAT